MHVDPYRQLSRSCDVLARRRLPWTEDRRLEGLAIADQVTAVRGYRQDDQRSDWTIRALVSIGADHSDAITVLVHALAGPLKAKLRNAATVEYVTDALSDLTFVVFDSIDNGEPDRLDHLARRYLARTHNRTWRAEHQARHHGTKRPATVDSYGPTRLVGIQDRLGGGGDEVATLATDRADLAQFYEAIRGAIKDGRLSERAWSTYRDHRLGRIFTPPQGPASIAERAAALRAARLIQPLAKSTLAVDAA